MNIKEIAKRSLPASIHPFAKKVYSKLIFGETPLFRENMQIKLFSKITKKITALNKKFTKYKIRTKSLSIWFLNEL